MSLCDVCHGFDVAHLEYRVGQGLDVEDLGVLLNGGFVRRGVAHVSHRRGNAKAREFFGQQTVGATVNVRAGDHVIALVEQGKERG